MLWTAAEIYPRMLVNLNERERRLYVASEALRLGYGGVSQIQKLSGISRVTIARGITELTQGSESDGRIRKKGGGRKKLEIVSPQLHQELLALLETKGDPMRTVLYTTQSVVSLQGQLRAKLTLPQFCILNLKKRAL